MVPQARAQGAHALSADHDIGVETYNPWSIVNLVFSHLADQGLHPALGATGDPGPPARALLVALGIEPAAEGNRDVTRSIHAHLAEIRAAVFAIDAPDPDAASPDASSHSET
jgi:hypothetical protein